MGTRHLGARCRDRSVPPCHHAVGRRDVHGRSVPGPRTGRRGVVRVQLFDRCALRRRGIRLARRRLARHGDRCPPLAPGRWSHGRRDQPRPGAQRCAAQRDRHRIDQPRFGRHDPLPRRVSRSTVGRPVAGGATVLLALVVVACGSARTTLPVRPVATTAPSSTAPQPTTTQATSAPTTSAPTTGAPSTGLLVGPGALAVYSVESQPAPGSCHYRWVGVDPLPDPTCTPGAVNPGVTQADIGTTICSVGWTATVRPPESVTEPEKRASAAAYSYTGPISTAEYDHLVPLELGGDPNTPANLWIEPNDIPGATSTLNGKDALEGRLRDLVCSGSLDLVTAQRAIASDWVAAAARYG